MNIPCLVRSLAAILLLLTASILSAAELEVLVRDEAGGPVEGASVLLVTSASRSRGRTDSAGRAAFPALGSGGATLVVGAPNFRRVEHALSVEQMSGPIEIRLSPAPVSETVTVTASRLAARAGGATAGAAVLSEEDLAATAAPTLEDALRQVAGFSLFRRSGSRTANPTAQGVSLRGVGASGASRAVVLDDGVPLNDPFGGWIAWGRVPRASVERIEVATGGASDLYGSAALAGVIVLARHETESPYSLIAHASYGSQETAEASAFASGNLGVFRASLSAEAFGTEGYTLVPEPERGEADRPADSRYETSDLTIERPVASGRVFLRGGYFEESRGNGTALQENDTRIAQAVLGGEVQRGSSALVFRAWGTDQGFRQSFSAVAADRESERPTRLQVVPAGSAGLASEWTGAAGARHALSAGFEARQVWGESREEIFTPAGSFLVKTGGRERTAALFLRDVFAAAPRLTVTTGLRVDRWWNEKGPSGIPDRTETATSPRLSLLYAASERLALAASAYRSFRAPTLNELYRSFRVGNVVTLANSDLSAERADGAETQARFASHSGKVSARAALFWMEVERAIGNVTVSATPSLVTRQRRNLGRTRSRGVELDGHARVRSSWTVSAGYLFTDSTVESFAADPELEGLRIPQVPRHQATLQLRHERPSLGTFGLQARFLGAQFEDDRNRLALGSFFTADAFFSRTLTKGLEGFLAAENLFDERYEIGRTPVTTLGPPRSIRAGLRLRLPE